MHVVSSVFITDASESAPSLPTALKQRTFSISNRLFFLLQNTIFALLGFVFFLSMGSVSIADADLFLGQDKKMKAVGSLCILNSFIYAAEGVLHGLNLRKDDGES